jgi:F1F0 ATPase subunit 2
VSALATVTAGLVGGAVGGAVFFGGLAATVRRLPASPRPAAMLAGSLVLRLLAVAALLVGLAQVGTLALLAGLVALLGVRSVLVRRGLRSAAGGPAR